MVPEEKKAKLRRRVRGKPQVLNNQQTALINRMKAGKNLTDASKGVYSSPAAAHRGLQRARIIASDAIHEMGLKPHNWLRPIARMAGAIEGEEPAKREIFVRASMFANEKKVTLQADDLQLKAAVELNKIYYAGDGQGEAQHTAGRDTVCVVVSDERAAENLAQLFASRCPTGPIINVDAEVHEDVG
jgi:hypothetical protein